MLRICPILERETDVEPTEYSRDRWQIVRCRETGFVYLADPPEYDALEVDFAWEKTVPAERERRVQDEPVYSQVSSLVKYVRAKWLPKRNKFFRLINSLADRSGRELTILDVGCGTGCLMEDLHQQFADAGRKIRPLGVEVSRESADAANTKFRALGGEAVMANAIEGAAMLEPNSIDVVIMSSFLEHEAQPLKLLRTLRDTMREDGIVILKVPNFSCWNRLVRGKRWCGFRYPDHVNYFTPSTLRLLADEANMPIARQNSMDKFPLSDNMYAILKKSA